MNTTQLGYFLTLAATRNYTTAAEQLFVTQPTLSRNIMALESEIGAQLFSRTSSGVSLTAAGEVLFRGIEPMFRQYKALLRQVQATGQGMAGTLTLALSSEQQMLPELLTALRAFREQCPNVVFHFQQLGVEALRLGLAEGSLDLGVCLGFPPHGESALREVVLATECPCLVTPVHDNAEPEISSQQCAALLTQYGVVFPAARISDPTSDDALASLREMLHVPDTNPHILFVQDSSALPMYIAAGMGATICNKSHSLSLYPGLCVQEITDAEPYRKVLQYHRANQSPLLKSFLSFFAQFRAQVPKQD